MKLEIDTDNKTIKVLTKVRLEDLVALMKNNNWEDWSLECDSKVEWIFPNSPYTPPSISPSPFSPPYIVTC